MGSKSGGQKFQQTTGSQTSAPAPAASQAITDTMARAQQVASQPYTPYSGQLVQGFSPQQQQAFGQVGALQGVAQPYINQATNMTNAAANSVSPQNWGQTVGSYMNPFASDVIAPTLANLRETFGQQRNAMTGASILGGGAGGSRSGVAQAELAREQGLAQGQTIGDLLNQMYGQASTQASTAAQLGMAGAGQIAGLGNQALQTGLTGTNALLQSGNLQQAQGQAGLSTAYQQWLQQQGFPYAQTGWLSSIIGGLAPELGGTTAGTQYTGQPQPSSMATNLGLGAAGLGFISQNPFGSLGSGLSNIFGSGVPNTNSMVQGTLYNKGGRVGRDMGGDLPEEKGGEGGGSIVPDPPIIAPKTNFPQLNLSSGSNNGSSGSGGSGLLGDIKTGAEIGTAIPGIIKGVGSLLAFLNKGGRANYADGGMSAMPAGLGDSLGGLPINLMGAGKGLGMTPPSEPFGSTGLPFSAGVGIGYIGTPPKISGSTNFPKLHLSGPSEQKQQQPGLASNFKEGQTIGLDINKIRGMGPSDTEMGKARGGRTGLLTGGTPDGSPTLDDIFSDAEQDHPNIPEGLLKKQAKAESGLNPRAISPQGAEGVSQFMPSTARAEGVADPFNPSDAIPGQARLMSKLIDKYGGDVPTALMEYHGGPDTSQWGPKTQAYPGLVLGQSDTGGNRFAGGSQNPGLSGMQEILQQIIHQQPYQPPPITPPTPPGAFLSPQAAQALMSFGFGMAASPARSVGQAAGQGGLEALKQYNSTITQERQNALEQAMAGFRGQQMQHMTLQDRLAAAQLLTNLSALQQRKSDLTSGTPSTDLTAPALTKPVLSPKPEAGASSPSSATNAPVAGTPSTATGAPVNAGSEARLPPSTDPFWKNVPPENNYWNLTRDSEQYRKWSLDPLNPEKEKDQAQANLLMDRANKIVEQGNTIDSSGNVLNVPGFAEAKAKQAATTAAATKSAETPYNLVEAQIGDGTTVKLPQSKLADLSKMPTAEDAVKNGATISKISPAAEAINKEVFSDQADQFKQRQVARQRLQALAEVFSKFEPGAYADHKAEFDALLRFAGVTKTPGTAAEYQEAAKLAQQNVFADLKAIGGKPMVSEITGLTKAAANPNLQPEANKAIIGQGLGLLDYEDKHYQDFAKWRNQNPWASSKDQFEQEFASKNNPQQFVKAATKKLGFKGITPPADPSLREVGETYLDYQGKKIEYMGDNKWKRLE